jgi:hypothetical protein
LSPHRRQRGHRPTRKRRTKRPGLGRETRVAARCSMKTNFSKHALRVIVSMLLLVGPGTIAAPGGWATTPTADAVLPRNRADCSARGAKTDEADNNKDFVRDGDRPLFPCASERCGGSAHQETIIVGFRGATRLAFESFLLQSGAGWERNDRTEESSTGCRAPGCIHSPRARNRMPNTMCVEQLKYQTGREHRRILPAGRRGLRCDDFCSL